MTNFEEQMAKEGCAMRLQQRTAAQRYDAMRAQQQQQDAGPFYGRGINYYAGARNIAPHGASTPIFYRDGKLRKRRKRQVARARWWRKHEYHVKGPIGLAACIAYHVCVKFFSETS